MSPYSSMFACIALILVHEVHQSDAVTCYTCTYTAGVTDTDHCHSLDSSTPTCTGGSCRTYSLGRKELCALLLQKINIFHYFRKLIYFIFLIVFRLYFVGNSRQRNGIYITRHFTLKDPASVLLKRMLRPSTVSLLLTLQFTPSFKDENIKKIFKSQPNTG